jgi:hypothetical protein
MRFAWVTAFLLATPILFAADHSGHWPGRNLSYVVDDEDASSVVFRLIHNSDCSGLSNYMNQYKPRLGWFHVLNHLRNRSGLAPFHRAVIHTPKPNTFILGLLVYHGADPNVALSTDIDRKQWRQGQFYKGWTAAHMAERISLSAKHKEFLTNLGCDFARADAQGWTPTMVNAKNKSRRQRQKN